jgi:hypothetical protein
MFGFGYVIRPRAECVNGRSDGESMLPASDLRLTISYLPQGESFFKLMRNSKKATNVIKRLALMSAIAFFTVMMAGGSALMQIQRDPAVGTEDDRTPNFAVAPPKVENVFVTALSSPTKAGNAILQVQFAKGERVGSQVSLTLDDQAIVLNDEGTNGDERAGDGVHRQSPNSILRAKAQTSNALKTR